MYDYVRETFERRSRDVRDTFETRSRRNFIFIFAREEACSSRFGIYVCTFDVRAFDILRVRDHRIALRRDNGREPFIFIDGRMIAVIGRDTIDWSS